VKCFDISVVLLFWQVVQNLNPIWNETFEFKELSGGEHLRLRVFDSDKLNMDQNIGVARVNLLVSTAELMLLRMSSMGRILKSRRSPGKGAPWGLSR
jgi:hypothetical protein